MRRALFLFLLIFGFGVSALAQRFDLGRDRVPVSDLNSPWRFQTGDDPRWADPAFDDSGWKLLKPDQPWSASDEKDAGGFAWYRFVVRIPPNIREPALFLPEFQGPFLFPLSLQVFADGRLIGSNGAFPPHHRVVHTPYLICPLPTGDTTERDSTIAIRAWVPIKGLQRPLGSDVRIGTREQIDAWARASVLDSFWRQSGEGYLLLVCLVGSGCLLLFFLRRNEREYLWFGLYELNNALLYALMLSKNFYTYSETEMRFLITLAYSTTNWFLILFVESLLKRRHYWPFQIARIAVVLVFFADTLVVAAMQVHSGQVSPFVARPNLLIAVGNVCYWFGVLYPLYQAARARVPDTAYLFTTFSLYFAVIFLRETFLGLADLGWAWPGAHLQWFHEAADWPIPLGAMPITLFLTQLAMLGILLLRFVRSRRDEDRMAGEFEAARAVQHVLIPDEVPVVPGFALESVYRPASQVGGDFFQIVPMKNGGVLAVIGDVSGKGMPAAMTVSLLVGTFRTLAHYTQSPGEILAAMNTRMLARSRGGFTTCLVLRVDPDGTLTVANAGHIAPYLAGRELPLENGLPLGLAGETAYPESIFHLAPGEQLTLQTDGVIEARDTSGALFGFDRASALSSEPAETIALAAQKYGQEDDITVLTLSLVGKPAPV